MYNHFFYRLDNSHGRPIDSIANEYELDDSNYFGSQSRSSSEKEREASYIDCTTYESRTIAGHYKTWTVDRGLDYGPDSGL